MGWKIALGALLFLLAGLTIALLNIDTIARIGINKALKHYLVAGGELEAVEVRLLKGSVALSGLTINPPPECGPHPLLHMNSLEVDVDPLSVFSDKIVVERVDLKGCSLNIVRDKKGRLSPMKLVHAGTPGPASPPAQEQGEPDPPWIPVVHVNAMEAKDLSIRLVDRMLEKDWSTGLGLDLAIEDLQVEDIFNLDILVGRIDLMLNDILVNQPPGFSREPLLAVDKLEVASEGINLHSSEISIRMVRMDTLSVSLERNADREINLLKLMDAWMPASGEGGDQVADVKVAGPAGDAPAPAFELPALAVGNIQFESIKAQVLDTIEGRPWRAGFDGLDVRIIGVETGVPGKQAIALASFDLDLKGVVVDQPPGFDNRKLFSLDHCKVVSGESDAPSKELLIKQVVLEGLSSSVFTRSDGVTSIKKLSDALLGTGGEHGPDKADVPVEEGAVSQENILPAVLFEEISLDGGPLTYRDEAFAEEPLEASLDKIQMEVKDLRLFSDNADVDPASASLSFEFIQPGELPTAYFGTLAHVGPVGNGVPMVNTQVRLVGLKLDTLGSLVPKSTRTALGASGLDVGLALAMDADSLNLNASVLTDHHIRYEGITVQGPLNKPVVKVGPVMTGVFGRVSDGLVNIGKGGLQSGVDIAEGGAQAARELGVGAVKIGENLGKSLFSATAGIVTFDKERMKAGTSGTTKGTVDLTRDSVKGSGKAAGGSLKSSASTLKGRGRVEAWEQAIPTRFQESMQHARTVLEGMPYPPVTQ